ncbi:RidA family protein [Falsigemmobacter intermedius]|uniref:RidA family protein n=1 Tax=Falsigemmobacter intermedius TaxID=1553448 RepID=A0A3S4XIZ3_9RHOB|nr:RidA family protein [Falsigemmobacter intermedius]RWY37384.1 RidA family protein [Falsigemmobacter intermedius]
MIERFAQNQRMSGAVSWPLSGRMIVTAGQVADNLDGTTAEQTANVLAKIDALLAEAGASKADVVSATIWLSDMAEFQEMNGIWDAWVAPGAAPARATVEAKLALPQFKVEIQVHAVVA